MSTVVAVNTYSYVHAVTYVTDKLLMSLKDIIIGSGLSPKKLADQWQVLELGITTWLETQDLTGIALEVYNPTTNALIGRWDFEIQYGFKGDGSFWVDRDEIQYHIRKAGVSPSTCEYRVVAMTEAGRPDVAGWQRTQLRSTDGFIKQSLGTNIDGSGLSAGAAYWRKV